MIYHGTTVILFINYITFLSLSFDTDGSERVRRGFCSTRNLDIPNGDYRLRSSNSVAKFMCNLGFQLYGMEQIVCFGSTWSSDPPMCISNTCEKIEPATTLRISEEFSGAVLTFSCVTLHKLEGSKKLICDGTHWSGQVPTCKTWLPPLACDFESSDLCGWSHNDKVDQDWRWNTGTTSTSRTGPRHDHTLGLGGNGHYMYFESSSPTRTGHKAVLMSPLYPAAYSRHACFSFWFHILGVGDIGDLELFFKPESAAISNLTRAIHVHENAGDVWHEETIRVTQQTEPFQVLLVATKGSSYRSDFAIDDVKLSTCTGILDPKNTTVTTGAVPTQSTIQTTRIVTTQATATQKTPTVATTPATATQTTPIVVTTPATATQTGKPQNTTVSTKTTKTISSTRVSTANTATPVPTVTAPVPTVTAPVPTVTAPVPTVTAPVPTVTAPVPTVTAQVPTSSKVTVFKNTMTQKHTQSKIQTATRKETTYYSKNTIKPVINPNLPVPESKVARSESKDVTSAIGYIIIGAGMFVAVASVVLAGMYCFRRQGTRRSGKECLSASNPVYRVMAGDEEAVQFAADDNEYGYSY